MKLAIVNSIRAFGGGEKWALHTAAGLRRRGFVAAILGHPGGALAERCPAARIPFRPVLLRHDVSPAAVLSLARALRQERPDATIFCNERAARVGVLAALLAGIQTPLVYRNGLEGSFKNKAHNRLLVGPRICRWVVNAGALRRELESFGWISPDRIRVVYNGVNPGSVDTAPDPLPLREQLGAAPEDVVLLTAARLVPEKGHAALLEVLARVAPRSGRWLWWIAGEGSEAGALRGRAEELGLTDRLRFLGFRTDVPRLLRAADILCHPSRREGAPNVVLEGMAAGLPVVGVAAPGTAELVQEGRTGLLAPVGDTHALERHVVALLESAELRRRLGEAGRERARSEFSEEQSLNRWAELLTEVIQRG